jgi:hypothetical protein
MVYDSETTNHPSMFRRIVTRNVHTRKMPVRGISPRHILDIAPEQVRNS